jgi:hypothetical protein
VVGSACCGTRRHVSLPMTTNRAATEWRSGRASIKRVVACQPVSSQLTHLALPKRTGSSFTWTLRCWRRDSEGSRIPPNSFTDDILPSRALNDSLLPTFNLFTCCFLLCLHFLSCVLIVGLLYFIHFVLNFLLYLFFFFFLPF